MSFIPLIVSLMAGCRSKLPEICKEYVVPEGYDGKIKTSESGAPLSWSTYPDKERPVDVYVETATTPEGVDPALAFEAIRKSFLTWEMEQGDVAFNVLEAPDDFVNEHDSRDGVNAVYFEAEDHEWAVFADDGSDINLFESRHDVQNIMTHEAGHALGLEHYLCENGETNSMCDKTSAGEIDQREISERDSDTVHALYDEACELDTAGAY